MNNRLCFFPNASMSPELYYSTICLMMAVLQVKGNSCQCEFNLQLDFQFPNPDIISNYRDNNYHLSKKGIES